MGVIIFVLLAAGLVYRSWRTHQTSGWRDPVIEMHDQKINELGLKAKDLSKGMDEAEKTNDKIRYMEFVKKAALNQNELDQEWKLLHESLRARQLGKSKQPEMMDAGSPAFKVFREEEKLQMLAKEHPLDLASLRLLKTQIGILFANEFRERFLEEIHDTLAREDFDAKDLEMDSP